MFPTSLRVRTCNRARPRNRSHRAIIEFRPCQFASRGRAGCFLLSGLRCILPRVTLSVVLITQNEECNLPRTLESVLPLVRDGKGEIIVVDSGSTDRTVEIALSYGAKVF